MCFACEIAFYINMVMEQLKTYLIIISINESSIYRFQERQQ